MSADLAAAPALLTVHDVVKTFAGRRGPSAIAGTATPARATALDGVSIDVRRGEIVGVVGESGSGKSTLARCIVRLHEPDSGQIVFGGQDITHASRAEVRAVRRHLQMVFQDPYSSLNPRLTVGSALAEPLRVHGGLSDTSAERRVGELLDVVGLAAHVAGRLPRELSGGQRQRVAIARALAVEPDLLVADEVVSALDVSVQAQILNMLAGLRETLGLAIVFIAHQLSVVASIADRVAVMYLGRIVEEGPTAEVFATPRHPYTQALLAAHPEPDPTLRPRRAALPGDPPSPFAIPSGCRFRTRCPDVMPVCAEIDPTARAVSGAHRAWCHLVGAEQAEIAPPR